VNLQNEPKKSFVINNVRDCGPGLIFLLSSGLAASGLDRTWHGTSPVCFRGYQTRCPSTLRRSAAQRRKISLTYIASCPSQPACEDNGSAPSAY
jgi:hypothetical protein